MKKVAIVGVEGSGKTVMLAGLGELYARPDENGFFLAPKDESTASFVSSKIARMRNGEWPLATSEDAMQGLDWELRRQTDPECRPLVFSEVSFLDFPGEVYRKAFGSKDRASRTDASASVAQLNHYIQTADDLIVLVNLRDVITNGLGDKRVWESMWITKSILDSVFDKSARKRAPRTAIVLSQADSYNDTILSCGGPKGVLEKYLPNVASSYGFLDVMAVSAVGRTNLDDQGNVIPSRNFQLNGLEPVMTWIMPAHPNLGRTVGRFLAVGCLCVGALMLGFSFARHYDAIRFGVSFADFLWGILLLLGVAGLLWSYVNIFSLRKILGRLACCALIGSALYAVAAIWSVRELGGAKRDPERSFALGSQCEMDKDYEGAVKWYRRSADAGNVEAPHKLGWMYENGIGVEKDSAEAVKWYRRSADTGNAEAQYKLGWMYENGMGVEKDIAEAVKWYRRSADAGNAEAQYKLGWMYENGIGVAKDTAEAVKWYRKASPNNQRAEQAWICRAVSDFLCQEAKDNSWDDFYLPSTDDFHDELQSLKEVAQDKLNAEIRDDEVIAILDCNGWGAGVVLCRDGIYVLKEMMMADENGKRQSDQSRLIPWAYFAKHGRIEKLDASIVQICESPFIGIDSDGCDLLKSDKAVPLFEGLLKIVRGEQ